MEYILILITILINDHLLSHLISFFEINSNQDDVDYELNVTAWVIFTSDKKNKHTPLLTLMEICKWPK